MGELIDLSAYKNVIDIGCGTGALSAVLSEKGFEVTGLDASYKMLAVAKKRHKRKGTHFIQADILRGLSLADKSFDFAITSFVVHGLNAEERKIIYAEMSRITRDLIIIYDYNERRSPISDLAEWLEGGNYFDFVRNIKKELGKYFGDVTIINMGPRSAAYVVKPSSEWDKE